MKDGRRNREGQRVTLTAGGEKRDPRVERKVVRDGEGNRGMEREGKRRRRKEEGSGRLGENTCKVDQVICN